MGHVVTGTYGPGARLPSERDLAAEYGTARVSVREALGILCAWRVVQVVPGSGAVVLPRRSWTVDALAPEMAHLLRAERWQELAARVSDAFELRRSVVLDGIERSARHLKKGSLGRAREELAAAVAAAASGDREAFLRADIRIIPTILETARMYPSLWLFNSMAEPYLAVVGVVGTRARPDPKYQSAHEATLDALEARDGARARARFAAHLRASDKLMIASFPAGLRSRLSIAR
jgi:DNA-binding FadR family transcriptional regulator